jgi:predicted lipoprotein with Yx(FWY)xxD motif
MDARMRTCLSICLALVATSALGADPAQSPPRQAPAPSYYYPPMPYGPPAGPIGYPLPTYPFAPIPSPGYAGPMTMPAQTGAVPAVNSRASTAVRAEVLPAVTAPIVTSRTLADGFRVEGSRLGTVLATANGRTLYAPEGGDGCRGRCSELWTPLMATGSATPPAPFGRIERTDGGRQWTYEGKPLYQWIGDDGAGDVTGDGVDGVWFAVRVRRG